MYPYIMIGDFKLHMTGLGIVFMILSFIFLVKFYTKRFKLNFWKFFNRLPYFLLIPYILGRYFYYLFETKSSIIPISIEDFVNLLSPYGYKFSFLGISLGLALCIILFLRSIKINTERQKRIDIFFYSTSISLIILGFFLTLGDTFIGKPTESLLGISSFKEDSQVYRFSKVYPVGLFLSLASIFSFVTTLFLHYLFKKDGLGVRGFMLLILLMNLVFAFQQYPQHLVLRIFNFTLGIKNYWTILMVLFIYWYHFKFDKEGSGK